MEVRVIGGSTPQRGPGNSPRRSRKRSRMLLWGWLALFTMVAVVAGSLALPLGWFGSFSAPLPEKLTRPDAAKPDAQAQALDADGPADVGDTALPMFPQGMSTAPPPRRLPGERRVRPYVATDRRPISAGPFLPDEPGPDPAFGGFMERAFPRDKEKSSDQPK